MAALILGAGVANMNLSVANVGLPEIGRDLGASQAGLNIVAVGFSLGLAATVLYLGALGDRYGRKMMLLTGLVIGIPAALMSAFATNIELLAISRLIGGFAAGMAYPTTLALITALWSGQPRTRSIALWSAIGGGISALDGNGAGPTQVGGGSVAQPGGPMHDILIEELELGVRSYNCLKRAGIQTVGDLVSKTEGELNAIPNFGKKSIDEVIETLHARGLGLRDE